MIMPKRLLIYLAVVLSLSLGCQTAPLGGTQWQVVELIEPDESDRAEIEANIQAMTLEFTPDGRIITTATQPDGTVVVSDRDRYRVDGELITISNPEYDLKVMYRFEDKQLRVHSNQFVMLMDPVSETR